MQICLLALIAGVGHDAPLKGLLRLLLLICKALLTHLFCACSLGPGKAHEATT